MTEPKMQPDPIAFEAGWGLYEQTEGTPEYQQGTPYLYYLWHNCEYSWWTARRDLYQYFQYPCTRCNCRVPQGLQALFVMLTEDMDLGSRS